MSQGFASAKSTRPDRESLGQEAARSMRHPLTLALLVLTFTTGLVDAASYLGLGNVFTANMTGNAIFLGFGLAGSGGLPVVAPLVSLAAFLVGAGFGGLMIARVADRHPTHFAGALAIEVALIGLAALLAAAIDVQPRGASGDAVIALIALAMGVRNATVRQIGVPDLTTTVLTGTLTSLVAKSPMFGTSDRGTPRRAAAVLAMVTGALVGALLLQVSLVLPLLAAAGLALLTWMFYVPAARRAA